MSSRALVFMALLASLRLGDAQTCPPQPVIVTVLDAHGLPIPGLPASSFRASSRGKPLSVLSASLRSDLTTRTCVLLDVGATMGGFGAQGIDKWKIARGAATDFLNVAPLQAQISLSTFSATIERTFESSAGRKALQDWLDNPESLRTSGLKGKAAIYRAILETAKGMEPAHPGDSILVITDGRNDRSFSMAADVSDELASRGIRLFAFVLDDSHRADDGITAGGISESTPLPNPDAKILSELVKASGGLGYTLYPGGNTIGQSFGLSYNYDDRTHQNVQSSISEIEIAISHFYILSVDLSGDARGPQDWQLEVVDDQGMRRKDVIVAYPARIAGCHGSPGK
jgi:hypothetical protein